MVSFANQFKTSTTYMLHRGGGGGGVGVGKMIFKAFLGWGRGMGKREMLASACPNGKL